MTDKKETRLTEQFSASSAGMDLWPNDRVLNAILDDQIRAVNAIRAAVPQINAAVLEAAKRLQNGKGRVIYIGAGTPARLGVQDGTELTPTFGWPPERLDYAIAGGKEALFKAVEGAEDDIIAAGWRMAMLRITKDDVCIAVSASGTTPYTVRALELARAAGAATIGIASNPNTPLLQKAEFPVLLDTGAEPVGGSTRLNAGTAQKIVLNMISTALMVRLGHVFDGMMVDVKLNNAKLRERAERMIMKITGCSQLQAERALFYSGQGVDANVKLAVLIVKGFTVEAGKELLEKSGGNLRTALDHLTPK